MPQSSVIGGLWSLPVYADRTKVQYVNSPGVCPGCRLFAGRMALPSAAGQLSTDCECMSCSLCCLLSPMKVSDFPPVCSYSLLGHSLCCCFIWLLTVHPVAWKCFLCHSESFGLVMNQLVSDLSGQDNLNQPCSELTLLPSFCHHDDLQLVGPTFHDTDHGYIEEQVIVCVYT